MSDTVKSDNGSAKPAFTTTNYKAIPNAPLPAEGSASFNNLHFAGAIIAVPWLITKLLPFKTGWTFYFFLGLLTGIPVAIGYWAIMSRIGQRINEKVPFPGKPVEHYIDLKNSELRKYAEAGKKLPMQKFHDEFFDGKVDFKGDVLEIMEYRHDWASFGFTKELFRYVFFNLIPEVVMHSRAQDEEQVRDHYDRGNDFYSWFLGERMVYTGGLIKDINKMETLEELQDNKMTMVCDKLDLKEGDRLLDIGCGWGTLVTHAAKNYGADVTGVTLAREQAAFGSKRLQENNIPESQGRILCHDFRDVPNRTGYYNKISCLEMAEHVGIRRYSTFLKDVYNLLADDGIMVFQVAGIRTNWQYEDLNWGLFMNKYVFPGADASLPLGWVVSKLEAANFEIKSVDVLGVHYAATIHRWYLNWVSNKDVVVAKYGIRWYRIWVYFLAYSVIISRQGSASIFQITCHKNLNGFHRIDGVNSHLSIQAPVSRKIEPARSHLDMWEKQTLH